MGRFSLGLLLAGAVALLVKAIDIPRIDKQEEYKIFIEDTARYSDRRQTVSNIYVAVNAILLSAAAVLLTGGNLEDWTRLGVTALLGAAGLAASCIWFALVHRYEGIIEKRVAELREIEKAIPDSHEMYRKMDEAFCGKVPSFSNLEKVLPVVFIVLHLLVLCLVFKFFS